MNYFELFGMPVQMKVNKDAVKRKYFELSKTFHPDYFVNEDTGQQQNALDTSAMLNKALNTFNQEDETLKYVLQLKGLIEEEEKYKLPPSFLMEMMEINEEVAEATTDADPNTKLKIYQHLNELEKELYEPVKPIIENYKDGVTTEEELLQVKQYYFMKKYLHRIYAQLK